MSQDMRRERAGVAFETIAGATHYIADMERENEQLKFALRTLLSLVERRESEPWRPVQFGGEPFPAHVSGDEVREVIGDLDV